MWGVGVSKSIMQWARELAMGPETMRHCPGVSEGAIMAPLSLG